MTRKQDLHSIYSRVSVSRASEPDLDRIPAEPALTTLGGELLGRGTAPLSKTRVACGSLISSISVFVDGLFRITMYREIPLSAVALTSTALNRGLSPAPLPMRLRTRQSKTPHPTELPRSKIVVKLAAIPNRNEKPWNRPSPALVTSRRMTLAIASRKARNHRKGRGVLL
jgi:hypothetical protein